MQFRYNHVIIEFIQSRNVRYVSLGTTAAKVRVQGFLARERNV